MAICFMTSPNHKTSLPVRVLLGIYALLNTTHEQFHSLHVALNIWCKPALITDISGVLTILGLDHRLQVHTVRQPCIRSFLKCNTS